VSDRDGDTEDAWGMRKGDSDGDGDGDGEVRS